MRRNPSAGITLVELLVASAISVVIAGALGTAFYQFFIVTNEGSEIVSALHQVQNAGHWLARDGQTACSAAAGSDLTLSVPNSATVTYTLSDNELMRIEGTTETRVARYITDLQFWIDGRVVTMSITASPDTDVSEQAMYKVCLRPAEGGQ